MVIDDVPIALTGKALADSFGAVHTKRKVIAEGFIYGHTINMVAADPGTGKSTISTQVAVELSAGIPVFGIYDVPRPVRVLYVQTERSIIELLERLEMISKVYPFVAENMIVTEEYQRFNLLNWRHVDMFINCIKRDCGVVDVIFIDPIYAMVSGGLKDDIPASAFTKAMSYVQKETGAVLWYNHHTVKAQYTQKGDKIDREDPFYGSQWIKAHVTASFHLKEVAGGVKLVLKKDNYNLMPKEILLDYDPETGLCTVPAEDLPTLDRLRNFIVTRKKDGRAFTFKEMCKISSASHKTVQRSMVKLSDLMNGCSVSTDRTKKIYQFKVNIETVVP